MSGPPAGVRFGLLGPPGTHLRQFRLLGAILITGPLLMLLMLSQVGTEGGEPMIPFVTVCTVMAVAAGAALAVGWWTPRPLSPRDHGHRHPAETAEAALAAFRRALWRRIYPCWIPILLGMVTSGWGGDGLRFYAVGFAFGWPLIVFLVWPRVGLIEGMRRRMESRGVPSYLWQALLAPAPPRR
ncbi:hypothetical protein GCM10009780_30370 [Actinomadura alba]